MNTQIKEFVKECNIHEEKDILYLTKKKLFKLDREIANLVLDYEVGTYAHMLDEYEDLRIKKTMTPGSEIGKLNVKMVPMGKKLKKMEKNPKIVNYLELKREYYELVNNLGKYYQLINVNFRELFNDIEVPNIFVFQGYTDESKKLMIANNIILPDINMFYREDKGTMIYPLYELTSKRDLRHFYNRVSFKYLEAMTNDYSFDLEGKKLGKIRVKK